MHLLHVFPSFQVGGSQRRLAALANHFGDQYQHTIISLDGCTEAAGLLTSNILNYSLPRPARMNVFQRIIQARRIIASLSPDLLVTYNWGAIEWAAANLFCLKRHVHIEDGFGPDEAREQLPRRVLLRRIVLNLHGTLVLPSRTLVEIAERLWRIDRRRIMYIPNGIPCARFRQETKPEIEISFRGTGPIIGTVATLRKEKAIDRLIHAFKILRASQQARLVIVGDGPERSSLEALTAANGLTESVTFTGNLEQPEHVLAAFDIFAVSSDTEQMPLSVLEAMAAGLPIVSTNVGDIRFMLAEENCPFIVERDAELLASAIRQLLNSSELQQRIGSANRARALSEFDEARMFSSYQSIFSGHA